MADRQIEKRRAWQATQVLYAKRIARACGGPSAGMSVKLPAVDFDAEGLANSVPLPDPLTTRRPGFKGSQTNPNPSYLAHDRAWRTLREAFEQAWIH